VTLDPPVLTDTVTIHYSADLRLVSDLVGAPIDELMALNPSLLRQTTPPDSSFDLHLPAGTATLFEQRISSIPEAKRNTWRYHRVAAGDTLESVAREYHVGVGELAVANQLSTSAGVAGMEALVVPVAPAEAISARALLYTTRKGDTLVTISDRFGISVDQLRRWNKISGSKVEPGRRLHVGEPSVVARSTTRHRHETTASGGAAANEKGRVTGKLSGSAKGSTKASAAHASAEKSGSGGSKAGTKARATSHAASKGKTTRKKKN
jgi:membrane-bound lytic murein transglycosylase D